MNPIQLEQILPQVQFRESSENSKTGDTSFADALRAAQNEDSDRIAKDDSVNLDEKSEKVEHHDENHQAQKSRTVDERLSESEETNGEEQSEKIALATVSFDTTVVSETNVVRTSDEQSSRKAESDFTELASIKKSESDIEVSEKILAWLMLKDSDSVSNKKDSDEFAALIDAAVEFIPGNESETEKLESAQNLVLSDPEKFLQNLYEFSEFKNTVDESKTSLAQVTDKKSDTNVKESRKETKISVHDLRTFKVAENHEDSIKPVSKMSEKSELNLSVKQQNDSTMQITMDLSDKAQQNITSSSSQTASANGSNFQQMLSNSIQANAPDFVKAGNVILKDNKQGTINLILRPESLGNVKISLNLNDKVINGQIAVQTKEAMDAFRESIGSLKQAFAESGFETGSFDLNFSNQQQSFAQNGGNASQNPNSAFMADRSYGSYTVSPDSNDESFVQSFSGGDYSVNIVA